MISIIAAVAQNGVMRKQVKVLEHQTECSIKFDFTTGNTFFLINAKDCFTSKRFTATGFSYQTQGLTFFNFEVHASDCCQKSL